MSITTCDIDDSGRIGRWVVALVQVEDENAVVDELRRQVMSLRDQLSSSQQRCNAVEAELSQRDKQLVRKSDQLQLTETRVGTVHSTHQVSFALNVKLQLHALADLLYWSKSRLGWAGPQGRPLGIAALTPNHQRQSTEDKLKKCKSKVTLSYLSSVHGYVSSEMLTFDVFN